MKAAIIAIAIAGCSFHKDSEGASLDADAAPTDASASVDATSASDAMPRSRILYQTYTDALAANASLSCTSGSDTVAETWYRVFALTDYAINTTMHVSSVDVAVQSAHSSSPITVAIALYTGPRGGQTIDLTAMTQLASATWTPADASSPAMASVPIATTIPAGAAFAVSVSAPDMTSSGSFVIGSTTSGEGWPGYHLAIACGQNQPIATIDEGAPGQIVIDVQGVTP